jgi:rhodanese-related sulfurtransferase
VKPTVLSIVLLGSLTLLAAVLTYFFHPYRPALYLKEERVADGEISIGDALARQKSGGVVWIDARRRSEFAKKRIPGALPLNKSEHDYDDQMLAVAKVLQDSQDKWVIVYCDTKKCAASHEIAQELRNIFPVPENVYVLHGGFPVWEAETGGAVK